MKINSNRASSESREHIKASKGDTINVSFHPVSTSPNNYPIVFGKITIIQGDIDANVSLSGVYITKDYYETMFDNVADGMIEFLLKKGIINDEGDVEDIMRELKKREFLKRLRDGDRYWV